MTPKRFSSLFTACVSLALVVLTAPAGAQFTPERAYAQLQKLPTLAREVWPADFNADGRLDLAAGLRFGGVVVSFGTEGASFGPDQLIAPTLDHPVGAGDVDHDGHADIIAIGGSGTVILPGNGDGTFGTTIPLGFSLGAPVRVTDMNNDGVPDLVGHGPTDVVSIYPGNGDFTFGVPTRLSMGIMAQDITVADLNGDGFLDVAGISREGWASIDVFLNQGAFIFTGARFQVPGDRRGLAITAHDLNGDGVQDLVATTGDLVGSVAPYWTTGFVHVFRGAGDGTFAAPQVFSTNRGPYTAVVGDFNGDGLPDVATGNQSYGHSCEAFDHLWDSISMLPGAGDGTLGPVASYALGNSEVAPDVLMYRQAHHRLHAADLDGNGRTDLIASPGAVLVATQATLNRSPQVDAGPDTVMTLDAFTRLQGVAIDPDDDWLTFTWTDETGHVVGNLPTSCPGRYYGTNTFTLTVTDGRGGTASDTVTITSPPGPGGLTGAWDMGSVGAVSAPGTVWFDGTTYAISGSGADIWGTADEFHYVRMPRTGDFVFTARILDLQNTHAWAKAGLMVRETLSADARHALLFATPTAANGMAFQRRLTTGGSTVHTPGPALAPPAWLRLTREGDVVRAFARESETMPWALVGRQTLDALADRVWIGFAVTSHADGTLATARFDNVEVRTGGLDLPAGWTSRDIGAVGATGSSAYTGTQFVVQGSGADIWGTQDAFRFQYLQMPGDGQLVARVTNLEGPHEWSKAGVMIRRSLDPSSIHHFLLASRSHGLAYQRRTQAGGSTAHTGLAATSSAWFRIRRTGMSVELAYGADGVSWTVIGTSSFPLGPALIGLAVTSHLPGSLATATFEHVRLNLSGDAWTNEDIGPVGVAGTIVTAGPEHGVSGNGADVWGTEDAFHFKYQSLDGDGSIVARVTGLQAPHPWTKAGVMIRLGASPSAPHAYMLLSRDHGLAFQRRTRSGSLTTHTSAGAGTPPAWVRLTRVGTTITAYVSTDGTAWTVVGGDTFPELAGSSVLVGLAVTSHADSTLATAVFDHVAIDR